MRINLNPFKHSELTGTEKIALVPGTILIAIALEVYRRLITWLGL
jgi:hypothetical protein